MYTGLPRRLTAGTATEAHPSLSTLEPLVQGAAEDSHSSLSRDGKTLAWNSGRSGYPDIWVKDLESEKESAITEGPREESRVLMSPDASKLAYMVRNGAQVDFYLAQLGKGSSAERLCENCGGAMLDWSPDGTELLYWWGRPIRFSMLNIASRKSQIVLQHAKYDLHRGQISPDGHWLAFSIPVESQSYRVLVTPLRKADAPGEDEWIEVATEAGCPHWSPDGNLLYFVSNRDGFWCLGAQALDPQTKRPAGPPIDVYHFHSARRSITSTLSGTIGLR
jgi:Tol biopolymer transport system component